MREPQDLAVAQAVGHWGVTCQRTQRYLYSV